MLQISNEKLRWIIKKSYNVMSLIKFFSISLLVWGWDLFLNFISFLQQIQSKAILVSSDYDF